MFLKFCQILGISSKCVQSAFRVCSECVQSVFNVLSNNLFSTLLSRLLSRLFSILLSRFVAKIVVKIVVNIVVKIIFKIVINICCQDCCQYCCQDCCQDWLPRLLSIVVLLSRLLSRLLLFQVAFASDSSTYVTSKNQLFSDAIFSNYCQTLSFLVSWINSTQPKFCQICVTTLPNICQIFFLSFFLWMFLFAVNI